MATLSILVEAAKLVEYDGDIYNKTRKKLMLEDEMKRTSYPVVHCPKKNMGYNTKQMSRFSEEVRRGNRETHNILEKNRRADMKNYFQVLKSNLPKLRDMVKASNVSILTDAVKHIKELTEADRSYQVEKAVLRKCQANLEERIRQLKEDIRRQHFCAQLFVHVQEEKKRVQSQSSSSSSSSSTSPTMTSKNIQADEKDIKAEEETLREVKTEDDVDIPARVASVETQANEMDIKIDSELSCSSIKVLAKEEEEEEEEEIEEEEEEEVEDTDDHPPSPRDMMSVMTQANEHDIRADVREASTTTASVQYPTYTPRSCLSDLLNDFSQNRQSGLYRPPSKMTTSLGKIGTEVGNSILACNGLLRENNSVGVQCRVVTPTPHYRSGLTKSVSLNRRKRKLDQRYDDSDSESELKIVCDEE